MFAVKTLLRRLAQRRIWEKGRLWVGFLVASTSARPTRSAFKNSLRGALDVAGVENPRARGESDLGRTTWCRRTHDVDLPLDALEAVGPRGEALDGVPAQLWRWEAGGRRGRRRRERKRGVPHAKRARVGRGLRRAFDQVSAREAGSRATSSRRERVFVGSPPRDALSGFLRSETAVRLVGIAGSPASRRRRVLAGCAWTPAGGGRTRARSRALVSLVVEAAIPTSFARRTRALCVVSADRSRASGWKREPPSNRKETPSRRAVARSRRIARRRHGTQKGHEHAHLSRRGGGTGRHTSPRARSRGRLRGSESCCSADPIRVRLPPSGNA